MEKGNKEFDINLLRSKQLHLLTKDQIIEALYKASDYQKKVIKEENNGKWDGSSFIRFVAVLEGQIIDYGIEIEKKII